MTKLWTDDHAWARRFLPEMKRIIGEYLIVEAPMEEDAHHNTDLIVLRLEAVRVACRVRQAKYLNRYGGQFTLRSKRPGGTKTELAKVLEGWGDYMLYGFADPSEQYLAAWMLGNLNVFRLWFVNQLARLEPGALPGFGQSNTDGSSDFRAFDLSALPAAFIVARHV